MELGSNFDLDVRELYFKPDNVNNYISKYDKVWFNYGRSAVKSIKITNGKKFLLNCNSKCNTLLDSSNFLLKYLVRCFVF